MFAEEDLLPLSALQHLVFCERQAALIHLERAWVDNAATIEGSHLHRKTDAGRGESRGDVRVTRGLSLRSFRLGVSGRSDVVEFHRTTGDAAMRGVELPGVRGHFVPFPVEYKRGRPKRTHRADEVQLCAQAMCFEEMLDTMVLEGALFYGRTRHRVPVAFDAGLRELTEQAAKQLHDLFAARITPAAVWQKKCRECSLLEICQPRAGARSAAHYVERLFLDPGNTPEEGD